MIPDNVDLRVGMVFRYVCPNNASDPWANAEWRITGPLEENEFWPVVVVAMPNRTERFVWSVGMVDSHDEVWIREECVLVRDNGSLFRKPRP